MKIAKVYNTLADLLGPLRYLGQCGQCKTQFMSPNEQVAVLTNHVCVCMRCASKYA